MVVGLQFNRSSLTVAGGGQVTVSVSNQDTGIGHNFAVYTDSNATQAIAGAGSNVCTAPCSFTLSFPAPQPGTYFFRCDVHPADMTGQFIVR